MKKKVILVSVAFALVLAFAVGMTIAYLKATTQTPVQNTFTVGNIQIDINEADVDEDNNTKENAYHIFPGEEYDKNPYVTVIAGSEECYVRMRVEVVAETAAAIAKMLEDGALPQDYVDGWDPAVWTCKEWSATDNRINLVFWYHEAVDASEATEDIDLPALFTKVLVPGELENEDLALFNNLQINVFADAIQTASFEGNMETAWAAFPVPEAPWTPANTTEPVDPDNP